MSETQFNAQGSAKGAGPSPHRGRAETFPLRADPTVGSPEQGAEAPPQQDFAGELPAEFGRYRVEKLLGSGGMGRVYLARDSYLDRLVALKIPRFDTQDAVSSVGDSPRGDSQVERFYREARSAATLNHPNICPIYDVGEIGGTHFISMGYVEGRPLSEYLHSGVEPSEREAAQLVLQLAIALQEAHERGVIHRDLKPANIVIDQRGAPIVMDFGLARPIASGNGRQLTTAEIILGTPAYMSPEQVEGRDLGPATDIYSLGVVLYELLAGRPPFEGTAAHVVGQVVHCQAPALEELRAGVSPELVAICRRAMEKAPDARFASMSEFAKSLAAFLKTAPRGEGLAQRIAALPDHADQDAPTVQKLAPPVSPTTVAALQSRRATRAWLAAIPGIPALVGLVILATAIWSHPPPPERLREEAEVVPREDDPPPPGPRRPPPPRKRPPPHDRPYGERIGNRPPPPPRESDSFADLDQDEDGVLSHSELLLHIIRRADTDGDEALTAAEYEAGRRQFGAEFFSPPRHGEGPPRPHGPPPPDW
jgi:serine/threonine protein kinase